MPHECEVASSAPAPGRRRHRAARWPAVSSSVAMLKAGGTRQPIPWTLGDREYRAPGHGQRGAEYVAAAQLDEPSGARSVRRAVRLRCPPAAGRFRAVAASRGTAGRSRIRRGRNRAAHRSGCPRGAGPVRRCRWRCATRAPCRARSPATHPAAPQSRARRVAEIGEHAAAGPCVRAAAPLCRSKRHSRPASIAGVDAVMQAIVVGIQRNEAAGKGRSHRGKAL